VKNNPSKAQTQTSELSKASIKERSKGPVLREAIRAVASVLVALSGLILLSDKVFTFKLENNFGFEDTQTFLWVFSQSISPVLLILGANFKPYKLAYIFPVYLYSIQLYWVFDSGLYLDDPLLHVYALGSVVVFVLLVRFIHIKLHKARQERTSRISLLERILDLYIKIDGEK